jgi:hypothetical protein
MCAEDRDCAAGTCGGGTCAAPLETPPDGDAGVAPGECTSARLVCEGFDDCIDVRTDASHCGGCRNACPDRELCIDGRCSCEPPGQLVGGACRHPGDRCDSPFEVELVPDRAAMIPLPSLVGDVPACGSDAETFIIALTVPVRSLVAFPGVSGVGLVADCATRTVECLPVSGCVDRVDTVALLEAGRHLVVLGGLAAVRIEHVPVDGNARGVPTGTTQTFTGTIEPGPRGICGAGRRDAYWYVGCETASVTASTCASTIATSLELVGAAGATRACGEPDSGCSGFDRLAAITGDGLHVLFVGTTDDTAGGDYELQLTLD